MNFKEVKELGMSGLGEKLQELRMELMKENAQVATKTAPKNPGKIRELKRTIARIHTLLKQKEGESTK